MKTYTVICHWCGDSITTRFRWRARRFAGKHGMDCSVPSWAWYASVPNGMTVDLRDGVKK